MATNQEPSKQPENMGQSDSPKRSISLDWWAVIIALALILLVWIGVIQSVQF